MSYIKRIDSSAPSRGFTLLELVVVTCIVAILATVLLNRIQFYQEQAEKAAMQNIAGAVRSALHLRVASMLIKGQEKDIRLLAEQNPMSWLAEKPDNYLGEYYAPRAEDVVSGHWYFDLQSRNLIYLVQNTAHFRVKSGAQNQVRFQVKLVGEEQPGIKANGEASEPVIEGVILEQVVPYTWF